MSHPQFVEYFDVVHVRLITVVVRENDPRPILSSLAKLLSKSTLFQYVLICEAQLTRDYFCHAEPGGYLQWDEVDTIGCSIKTVPGTSAKCLEKITSQLSGTDT